MAIGPLETALQAMLPRARLTAKAQFHVDASAGLTGWTTADGIAIRIVRAARIDATLLTVDVAAVDTHGKNLPVDNPFQFVNPPLKIPDGTTRAVLQPGGETLQVANLKEDVAAAFKSMVADAVLTAARLQGWAG